MDARSSSAASWPICAKWG